MTNSLVNLSSSQDDRTAKICSSSASILVTLASIDGSDETVYTQACKELVESDGFPPGLIVFLGSGFRTVLIKAYAMIRAGKAVESLRDSMEVQATSELTQYWQAVQKDVDMYFFIGDRPGSFLSILEHCLVNDELSGISATELNLANALVQPLARHAESRIRETLVRKLAEAIQANLNITVNGIEPDTGGSWEIELERDDLTIQKEDLNDPVLMFIAQNFSSLSGSFFRGGGRRSNTNFLHISALVNTR